MTRTIQVFIPGVPVPKGSAKAFYVKSLGRALVVQDNAKKQKPWASMIAVMTRERWNFGPVNGAVRADMLFVMPRPKSHLRANGGVKDSFAQREHTSKPDVDKLARCVLDALTGVLYADDSQVVEISARKTYGGEPGCMLTIHADDGTTAEQEAQK
jgi:Holliday junction resolvase RusA-like endonuclease